MFFNVNLDQTDFLNDGTDDELTVVSSLLDI